MTTSGGTRTSSSAWRRSCSRLRSLAQVLAAPAGLLYPPECLRCGRALPSFRVLCADCAEDLPQLEGNRCLRCGAPVEDPLVDLCTSCGTRERGFDRVVALGPYEGPWGGLVRALKFDRETAVCRWLCARLAEAALADPSIGEIDWVTFVPMTWAERRARGFNQARRLARGVARRLDLPLRRSLRKTRRTAPQASLPAAERRRNLRGAYRAVPSRGGRVLLVDDICTTGSTAEACARTLREAGCASVSVLVVARA